MTSIPGRIRDALAAACHPAVPRPPSVRAMGALALASIPGELVADAARLRPVDAAAVDAFVIRMYHEHAAPLVRLVRLFVDDRNAAEDLVQEAFIRLARNAHRIEEPGKAVSYLRSIVLN